MNVIAGKEHPLSGIFSKLFDFHIPGYQRPYSWTTTETSELLSDLYEAFRTNPQGSYFLGSIVLIKKDEQTPHADVVDGQQRLTTLTILLSVFASKFTGEWLHDCDGYLKEPGSKVEGRDSEPRLHLRKKDEDYFGMVQRYDVSALQKSTPANEAQKHIKENWECVNTFLTNWSDKEIEYFFQFIMTRCYIIAVTTPTEESAFRIFSVLNDRGMDLLPVDILKSEIIGKIHEEKKQTDYTGKWENMEIELGRNGFNDLFTYIRMIYAKVKSRQTLVQAFKEDVLEKEKDRSAESFIDDVLTPYQKAYDQISRQAYESTANAEEINRLFGWLNNIDFSDWIPAAMLFLRKFGNDSNAVLAFFKKLERFSAFLHLTNKDVFERINRFAMILEELDSPDCNGYNIKSVDLTEDEKKKFLETLDGPVYDDLTARRRNYLIMRLDSFVSDQSKATDYKQHVLSIEHVLPQTVDPDSEWAIWWPDLEVRKKWLHRIGNLVPLSRRLNSAAQNYKFDEKKKKYFKNSAGACAYPLTAQVTDTIVWKPEIVEKRQKDLLKIFKENWEL
ncbi:MAG: DUF262 domain-containing protein [Thermoguttaceae bacterium]